MKIFKYITEIIIRLQSFGFEGEDLALNKCDDRKYFCGVI